MNLTRRIAEMMTTNLYLAYGSNLNLAQMRYRCPTAKVVGYTYLPDRKLVFRGSSMGSYLTLDETPGAYPGVPCGVFEITERDLMFLDLYEGYPRFYRRSTVPVDHIWDVRTRQELPLPCGKMAMVYFMRIGHDLGQPAESYWQTCMRATPTSALTCGFWSGKAGQPALVTGKARSFHGSGPLCRVYRLAAHTALLASLRPKPGTVSRSCCLCLPVCCRKSSSLPLAAARRPAAWLCRSGWSVSLARTYSRFQRRIWRSRARWRRSACSSVSIWPLYGNFGAL